MCGRLAPVSSATQHVVTASGVEEEQNQEHRIQNPDRLAPPCAKIENRVHDIDNPTENEQWNSQFLIVGPGWDKREEPRRKHVNQRPKTEIDRQQDSGAARRVQDGSCSKGNSRNFLHRFVLEHCFPGVQKNLSLLTSGTGH